jgi:anti-sigma B factor antagonist
MDIDVRRRDGVCVVGLKGRLILGGGDETLRRRFHELLDGDDRRFVFDLSGLSYMDSAGIGELVASAKRAGDVGAIIRIVSQEGSSVRQVFALTQLDRVFEIYEDADAAVRAYA